MKKVEKIEMKYNNKDIKFLKNYAITLILICFILFTTISYIIYTMFITESTLMLFIKFSACLFLTAFLYQIWIARFYLTKAINEIRQEISL